MTTFDHEKNRIGNQGNPGACAPAKSRRLLRILLVCLVLALLSVALLVWIFLLAKKPAGTYAALYLKDRELSYLDYAGGNQGQLSAKLSEKEESDLRLSQKDLTLEPLCGVKNNRYLFFVQNRKAYVDAYTMDLMVKDLTQPDAAAVFIDTINCLDKYYVSEDASSVVYRKRDGTFDGTLCRYYREDGRREVLAKNARKLHNVSADGKAVYYFDGDGGNRLLYGTEPRAEFSDVQMTEDASAVYGVDGIWLCRLDRNTGETVDLEQGVSRIVAAYNGDRVYYNGEETEGDGHSLYYFDGKKSVLLTESYDRLYFCSPTTPVVVYQSTQTQETFLCVEGKSVLLDFEKKPPYNVHVSPAGDCLYFVEITVPRYNCGPLVRMDLREEHFGNVQTYAENVHSENIFFLGDGRIAYYKLADDKMDLYVDGERIDGNLAMERSVALSDGASPEERERIVYYTDWSTPGVKGTLRVWDGQTSVTVAEGVRDALVTSDGHVLYLKNTEQFKSELYEWYQGETKKIADGVHSLITVRLLR